MPGHIFAYRAGQRARPACHIDDAPFLASRRMTTLGIVLVAPMIAPITDSDAPLGGAQAFLADLARGLVAAGHQVTLLAARGSSVTGVCCPDLGIDAAPLRDERLLTSASATTQRATLAQHDAFRAARGWLEQHCAEVDVVHAHAFDAPAFDTLADIPRPVLHTLHLPPLRADVVHAAVRAMRQPRVLLIAVSESSRRAWRAHGVDVMHVIPNGVDLAGIPFGATPHGYLLFAGRLAPEKGAAVAIGAARRSGYPLLLVGAAYDAAYTDEQVLPFAWCNPEWSVNEPLDAPATWIGARPRHVVHQLMATATATLVPSLWEEPFGLAAVEAQAAGSPVVAFDRGGLHDVVANGRTGVLVAPNDEIAFAQAIPVAADLDRAACRAWIADRFSIAITIVAHEALYRRAVAESA